MGRSLLLGPRVALVTSERQFKAAKKSAGVACDDAMLEPGWNACVHAYDDAEGNLVCIVALNLERCRHASGIDMAALLAHEAVHVWQRVRQRLGPSDLGMEMEAYAVQNIVGNLMRAYASITSRSSSCPAPG